MSPDGSRKGSPAGSPKGSVVADRVWKRFRADRRPRSPRERLRQLPRPGRKDERQHWRWALQDLSLELSPGESLGVIGSNGSGKSTLLKILGEVMFPYAGRVVVAGRVGALIQVRAGIHPELTGRENILLSGSLLGLRRREIAGRLDEIVHFAELEDAVDRQAKFYSTGMQMRLGFGVAAFLEPDVLLVDEALSVGDATFQQRCLDRMRTVLSLGTTLVFVSHDLAAVESMCNQGLWLRHGLVASRGTIREVATTYQQWVEEAAELSQPVAGQVSLIKAATVGDGDESRPRSHGRLEVVLVFQSDEARSASVCLGVSEGTAAPAILVTRQLELFGETEVRCSIGHLPLAKGRYFLWVGAFDGNRELLPWQPVNRFDVVGPAIQAAPHGIVRSVPILVDAAWEEDRR